MIQNITIPKINKDIAWENGDYTFIIGQNGTGKTLLMNGMMEWCDSNNVEYIHYDALTALSYAKQLIDESEDDAIILACKMMSELSLDFIDDIKAWSSTKGYKVDQTDQYMKDAELLRHVLHLAGNGYTRLFIITITAINSPTAGYYFLDMPETSLHVHLAKKVTDYIMYHFKFMKLVVVTHSPEMLNDYNMYVEPNDNIISLPEAYDDEERNCVTVI